MSRKLEDVKLTKKKRGDKLKVIVVFFIIYLLTDKYEELIFCSSRIIIVECQYKISYVSFL